MPEKTFKDKAQKYKRKYYEVIKAKGQEGGNIAEMSQHPQVSADTYQNMISMVGGEFETPENLDYMSD